jgi:DNA cross-link repair 1A protein
VIADARAQVLEGRDSRVNTLYVFGAYGIGKERVYMSAARALGVKVFVDKTRWRTCLCYDEWGEEERSMLTTDENATNVHVVYLGQVSFNHLAGLRKSRPGCTRVVAFLPTGWNFGGGGGGGGWARKKGTVSGAGQKRKADGTPAAAAAAAGAASSATAAAKPFALQARSNGTDFIYPVPYSEHSSFSELVSFMDTFRPNVVIPTVNTSEASVKKQIQFLKDANPQIYTPCISTAGMASATPGHGHGDAHDDNVYTGLDAPSEFY